MVFSLLLKCFWRTLHFYDSYSRCFWVVIGFWHEHFQSQQFMRRYLLLWFNQTIWKIAQRLDNLLVLCAGCQNLNHQSRSLSSLPKQTWDYSPYIFPNLNVILFCQRHRPKIRIFKQISSCVTNFLAYILLCFTHKILNEWRYICGWLYNCR